MVFDLMSKDFALTAGLSIYLTSVKNHLPSPTEAEPTYNWESRLE